MPCVLTVNPPPPYVCPFCTSPTHTDVNECEREEDDCQPSQQCINTLGAFTCQCPDGYRKVGTECIGKTMSMHLLACVAGGFSLIHFSRLLNGPVQR